MTIGGERKFTGILHDLSDRVALEQRLRASEARWRSIIQSAVDGIVVIDAHGRIEAFNPAAERLFGYSEEELLGQNVNVLMPSPYHEEHDTYLARYLATGRAKIIGTGREVTGRRRDGTTFPLHLSVGEITVEGERKFTGILHDLTARVRLEEQLREGAALAKVGEMAAVIAHEVKNPLAGIRGAIQVIGGRLPAESRDAAVLNDIVKRIDALDGLMKDLLLFARPPQPRRASVDVVPLVTMTADLLCQDPALKDVQVEVDGSAPPVLADAEMLKIVFQNLLVNSAHAMQGRGQDRRRDRAVDGTCQIAFTDTGPGSRQRFATRSSRRSSRPSRGDPGSAWRRPSGSSRRIRGRSRSSVRRLAATRVTVRPADRRLDRQSRGIFRFAGKIPHFGRRHQREIRRNLSTSHPASAGAICVSCGFSRGPHPCQKPRFSLSMMKP